MNQKPSGSLVLSKAVTGFSSFKSAQGLSDRTIDSYQRHLQKWLEYQGDLAVHRVTSTHITTYLDWLRAEYIPQRFGKGDEPLSPKILRNIWVALSAFFTWATKEFQIPNPMANVPAPRFVVHAAASTQQGHRYLTVPLTPLAGQGGWLPQAMKNPLPPVIASVTKQSPGGR